MAFDKQVILSMILRIADFFRFMADNEKQRLYYVVPIDPLNPYAFQHSSIRDVGTLYAILILVQFFREQKIKIDTPIFENVTRNTLNAYHTFYQKGEFDHTIELNIGDLGYFLLTLKTCEATFPALLPPHWKEALNLLTKMIIERQKGDGSISIFFIEELDKYNLGAEAFYLPEALIGLLAVHDKKVESAVERSIAYLSQNYQVHIASDYDTFYFNWQFQLLYQWIKRHPESLFHFEVLTQAVKKARIASIHFGSQVATVEVACYLEGLVHAQKTLKILGKSHDEWMEREIDRCVAFLYELQQEAGHGGFVHSRSSHEARVDVTGHVLGGLLLLLTNDVLK